MIISKLSLLHFKNIQQATIDCSSKMNFFFGNNGMGKTNLLDALYFLSFCKSHLHTADSGLIQEGEEVCVVQGVYEVQGKQEEIFCGLRKGHRKQFKRNQKAYTKFSEHIGLLPLVMISPADADLIRGGSDERRRLLDVIISQYDSAYLHALIHYNKALAQRNTLLRGQMKEEALFEVLEMQMALHGEIIYQKRHQLVEQLVPLFNQFYQTICRSTEEVHLAYQSQLASCSLEQTLRERRAQEFVVGYSLVGIHKDDLEMTLRASLIRHRGSQGQTKSYLIALKLAQFAWLSQQAGMKPLLLLDDIFDKLDAERVEQIIQLVCGEQFGQIFMTDTNRKYLDRILRSIDQECALFKVDQGVVESLKEEMG